MGKLQGKVAVITGGTAEIGLAAAKLFVAEGAYVFITGRRKRELDDAVKEIGNNVFGIQGDVADLADLDRLYETVGAKGRRGESISSSPTPAWRKWLRLKASQKGILIKYSMSM